MTSLRRPSPAAVRHQALQGEQKTHLHVSTHPSSRIYMLQMHVCHSHATTHYSQVCLSISGQSITRKSDTGAEASSSPLRYRNSRHACTLCATLTQKTDVDMMTLACCLLCKRERTWCWKPERGLTGRSGWYTCKHMTNDFVVVLCILANAHGVKNALSKLVYVRHHNCKLLHFS
jgi:hypothetical protein